MYGRPSTAATTCSTGTSATGWRGEVVLSIIANRANEIGACSCNLHTLEFKLYQYADQPTVPLTLMLMHQLGVGEVVLPNTMLESDLCSAIRKSLPEHVTFLSLPRRDYNEVKGLRLIEHASCDPTVAVDMKASNHYLAAACASACIAYVEYLRKAALLPRSVRVSYECLRHRVGIDRDSCGILNIVAPTAQAVWADGDQKGAAAEDAAAAPGKDAPKQRRRPATVSLMSAVDHTVTPGGQRLMRSNLMMPVSSEKTLRDRLDAVEYLKRHDRLRMGIRGVLRGLVQDVDHLLSKFVMSASGSGGTAAAAAQDAATVSEDTLLHGQGANEANVTATIKHVLGLRGVIQALPDLIQLFDTEALKPSAPPAPGASVAESERLAVCTEAGTDRGGPETPARGAEAAGFDDVFLLKQVHNALLLSSEFEAVQRAIDTVIDNGVLAEADAAGGGGRRGGSAIVTKTVHVYAVRQGVDGLLDQVRTRYSQSLEAVYGVCSALTAERAIPSLKVVYKPLRGFVLQCDNGCFHRNKEVCGFILASSGKRKTLFSTRKLVSLNNRLKDSYREIMERTNAQVARIVDGVRSKMGFFFRVSEAVSLLDFVQSIAQYCSLCVGGCCRPSFLSRSAQSGSTSSDLVRVVGARHPFWEATGRQGYVPNDVTAQRKDRVVLLSGANMSGKSTYLVNIALLFVLAHVGFLLPAQSARLFLVDRLFTRISMDDSVEGNASTFTVEMREMAYILHNATENSLVIIDELGRGTSHHEGAAIALACVESLASRKRKRGLTFFATHFKLLHLLAEVNAHVSNMHCSAAQQGDSLRPLFKVQAGSFYTTVQYGIALARDMGFPDEVVADATALRAVLDAEEAAPRSLASQADQALLVHTFADKVLSAHAMTCRDGAGQHEHLRPMLARIKDELLATLQAGGRPDALAQFLTCVDAAAAAATETLPPADAPLRDTLATPLATPARERSPLAGQMLPPHVGTTPRACPPPHATRGRPPRLQTERLASLWNEEGEGDVDVNPSPLPVMPLPLAAAASQRQQPRCRAHDGASTEGWSSTAQSVSNQSWRTPPGKKRRLLDSQTEGGSSSRGGGDGGDVGNDDDTILAPGTPPLGSSREPSHLPASLSSFADLFQWSESAAPVSGGY